MKKEDVKNITYINKRWEDIELGVDIWWKKEKMGEGENSNAHSTN